MSRLVTFVRWTAQSLFTLTSVAVAAYAFSYLYLAFSTGDPFAAQFAVSGVDVPAHFFAAGLALLLAPLQLSRGLRRRWPALHRTAGWLYVAAIAIGAVSGLSLAFNAQGGVVARIGFGVLALLWPAVTARGVWLAVRGDTAGHREWMCRSVALTYGAVTLRVMLGSGIAAGLPLMPVYAFTAWGSWLLNLAVCELLLRRPWRRARRAGGGTRWASRPAGA